ncbi:MAG: zinc-ribbon domain-containing protein [Lachnospiraceae bacterium]|nr:zinc-ribbon domain-containing protein [Lachnospiraceae bacterium]
MKNYKEETEMYCKKCGNQIDEGAAFCKKCGSPVKETVGKKETKEGAKTMSRKWMAVAGAGIIAVATLLIIFFPGKKDKYSGYYTCIVNGNYYAIQIDGDEIIGYSSMKPSYHNGYISTGENCIYTYFSDARWQQYSPFTITLSDNGEKMYFSSEDARWTTDIYDAVSKSEFEDFFQKYLADKVEQP